MDFAAFRTTCRESGLAYLSAEIAADLLTPASAFLQLGGNTASSSFLFESVEGGESVARYSFLGVEPAEEIRFGPEGGLHRTGRRWAKFGKSDLFRVIRSRLTGTNEGQTADSRFALMGGWVGYFAYDCVRLFERLPEHAPEMLGHPWVNLGLYDQIVVFDHVRQTAHAVVSVHAPNRSAGALRSTYDRSQRRLDRVVRQLERPTSAPRPTPVTTRRVRSNMSRQQFMEKVRAIKRHIGRGDIFQGVLSQRFSRDGRIVPFDVYRRLRRSNPSPYMYFLKLGDLAIAGSSPETLVQKRGPVVITRPIAGTRPRGQTPEEDRKREQNLRQSPKENAEHLMLVDLGRNDLGRVSRPGTVRTEQFRAIDRYSHVMHMVSTVTGQCRRGVDALDVLAATFPAGTVTGAPKIRAMEIIDALEPGRRGVYAGGIGYIDWGGNFDMALAIRTAVMDSNGAHVQAGAGIVADSDPDREYQETCSKAAAPLAAIGGVIDGRTR